MHITEGELRRFLDRKPESMAEPAIEKHLAACERCRTDLQRLSDCARRANDRLGVLDEIQGRVMSPEEAAGKLRLRLKTNSDRPALRARIFAPRYRTAWASAGIIIGLGVALLFPPVQAMAGRFLSIFRLRQFSVVQVNPENVQKLERLGSSSLMAQLMSDSVRIDSGSQPQQAADTDEASLLARMQLRVPAMLPEVPRWSVQPELNITLALDLARIKSILEGAGYADIQLPESLQGAEVSINLPPRAVASYGDCGQSQSPDAVGPAQSSLSPQRSCTTLMQMVTPTAVVPQGLDVDRLGLALLQLLGVTAEEAARLSSSVDWTSTFVIPIPQNAARFEEVEVRGNKGTLIQVDAARTGRLPRYLLIWTESGTICALNGVGTAADAIAIADSLR